MGLKHDCCLFIRVHEAYPFVLFPLEEILVGRFLSGRHRYFVIHRFSSCMRWYWNAPCSSMMRDTERSSWLLGESCGKKAS